MNLIHVRPVAALDWDPRLFRPRGTLLIENLALRQQLAVFQRQHARPRPAVGDKLLWVVLRRLWPSWKTALILVSPDTVVRWHRAGFQLYWGFISRVRKRVGRRPVSKEVRELIFKMVACGHLGTLQRQRPLFSCVDFLRVAPPNPATTR